MPFDLEVEFTGLCFYVTRERPEKVTVLMPDARRTVVDNVLGDGTIGEPHVGYLRASLANLADFGVALNQQGNALDGPRFEVVYQFDRQKLTFNIDNNKNNSEPIDCQSLGVPSFDKILNGAPLIDGLFDDDDVPPELLFRTELRGGVFRGRRGNGNWRVGVNGNGNYQAQFSETVTWKYPNIENSLVLTLSDFDGGNPQILRLAPTENDRVIRLKIANLCSLNPLEWDWLTTHVETKADVDFKWLYRLFAREGELPVPALTGNYQAFGAQGCLGGDDE